MSAMLRAHRSGGAPLYTRRVRSLSEGSSSPSDSSGDEGGARLSDSSEVGTPLSPKVRFSSMTQEFSHVSIASSVASGGSARDPIESSPFQVGKTPDGDIFTSSPKKSPLKLAIPAKSNSLVVQITESPLKTGEERHLTRSVTTGSAAVLNGTPGKHRFQNKAHHEIDGRDVQEVYPPSSCIFVANLPESQNDTELETEVTREFSQFGIVFVKIRRDCNRMPFAFCQYTNDDHADAALTEGKGIMILGRPCRTERVKANRSFVIYNCRGVDITPAMAREILEPYGEISKCEQLSAQMQEAMKLPPAVLVEFAAFDPKRDLNSVVREHDGYRIDAFHVKKRNMVSRADANQEFLRKYDVDRRSIFVGGVPIDADEEEVIDFFSEVGEVVNVDIVKRTTPAGYSHAFAFVEFKQADLPDHAVKSLHGALMRGSMLKVERKVFKHTRTPRRVKSQAFAFSTPKTPRGVAPKSSRTFGGGQNSGSNVTPAHQTPGQAQQGYQTPGQAQQGYQTPGQVQQAQQGYPTPGQVQQAYQTPGQVQQGYQAPGIGQQFPLPAVAAIPAPVNVQPVIGASGLPCMPVESPFQPVHQFPFTGGYWPGITQFQDPSTGYTFYSYTPTRVPTEQGQIQETPTRAPGSALRQLPNGA